MKSAVCVIARNENDYLLEWIDYHLNLGFDKIFLYDNNDPGNDSVNVLLASYVAGQQVEVIDYRGRRNFQLTAYNECYKNYGCLFDWIAFIDLDEFITFGPQAGTDNINVFLKDFESFDVLVINWMLYNDNEKVYKEEGKILQRFTHPLLSHSANIHVKSIVRTNCDVVFRNSHYVDGKVKIADEKLQLMEHNGPFRNPTYERLYIRHYVTKSLEEYILCKMHRGAPDFERNSWRYNLYSFYHYNKRTAEKRKLEKKLCPLKVVLKTDLSMFLKAIGLERFASSKFLHKR